MSGKTSFTLLEQLADGSGTAVWEQFFDRYWRLVYSSARRRGCSEHTADEIVQEVMLAVFEKRDVFHYDPTHGRFRDWLAGMVRNQVAAHRRRPAQRIRAVGGDSGAAKLEQAADRSDTDVVWESAFEEAMLVALLELIRRDMNPRTYQAFELFTLGELPARKVARMTGLTRTAVYEARRSVFRRLDQLGASYREQGRLTQRVKDALAALPRAGVERTLLTRITEMMQS